MTIVKEDCIVDEDSGFKSDNKYEVAYQILMDYFNELPEESRTELDKRLQAIGV
tara:strand:+ start:2614 stop:2775 length:162 start_codon:yes stop_codon:yes gene_type:complete